LKLGLAGRQQPPDGTQAPVLFQFGLDDPHVPKERAEEFFNAANEPKRFVPVPGGGHNDPPAREYLAALDHFFDSLPGRE